MATLTARLADLEDRLRPHLPLPAGLVLIVRDVPTDDQALQIARARAEGRPVILASVVSARIRPDLPA